MSNGAVQVERVVELTRTGETSSYRLHQAALSSVLEGVGSRPVAVVSIAGVSRGGKSFLLNYCLRYLQANNAARRDGSWLGSPQQNLTGFSWSGGHERNTIGIWLSTPQEVTLPSGENVAVMLMDTQGTFDCQSSLRDCSTIFALSTLLSSVQIYNLKENITSNDLQYLKYFADYGRLAMSPGASEPPFQALRFLVRDCYEPPYGLEGGRRLLEARIGERSQLTPELHAISREIRRCFESVDCYLMPHPGLGVPGRNYGGNVAGLEPAFKDTLRDLIPSILGPNNLQVKKLNGLTMTGQQLFQYFQSLLQMFSSDNMPELRNLADLQGEATLANAAWTAHEQFRIEIERTCGESAPRCPPHVLLARYARAKQEALRVLDRRSTASAQQRQQWLRRLEQELDAHLNQYVQLNERKNTTAVTTAKNVYERTVLGGVSANNICKHPRDLTAAHGRAEVAALQEFDRNRERPTGDDTERNEFKTWISRRHDEFKTKNESNNNAAVTSCHEYFLETMPGQTENRNLNALNSVYKMFTQPFTVMYEIGQDLMSSEETGRLYTETKREALERFDWKRNTGGSSYDVDSYKERLVALIEEYEFPASRYEVFGSVDFDDPYGYPG